MKLPLLLETSTCSLLEFQRAVETISNLILPRSVVLLSGPMAAGKTELVKIFCARRGIGEVSSPTFALHHHYQSDTLSVDHLDLYRIEKEEDLESTGFWDLFAAEPSFIFIEWSEKMDWKQIPPSWNLYLIKIEVLNLESRKIQVFKKSD